MVAERAGLALRLVAFVLIAALLVFGLGAWLLRQSVHQVILHSFELRLEERLERVAARLHVLEESRVVQEKAVAGDEFEQIFSGWYWQVQGPARPLRSRSLWDRELEPLGASVSSGLLRLSGPQGEALLGIARDLPNTRGTMRLYVFGPAAESDAELGGLDRLLALSFLAAVLVLPTIALLQVRFGLSPLLRMRKRLSVLERGEATSLGASYGPDLDPLARQLDDMLLRNARIVERARSHSADLSHALKKPLSLLASDAAAGGLVPAARVMEQVQRLSAMIDRYLARAGSGAGERRRVEVTVRITALLELMEKLHRDRGLQWELLQPAQLHWRGEAEDLEEMLGNLMDNAGKWARRQVRVSVVCQADGLCVLVEDDGVGLTPEQISEAARRGRRFDEAVEGSGLGLAIVSDIAETYQGHLTLEASALGGLAARLYLPG